MKLYLHVDRTNSLKSGTTLDTEPYPEPGLLQTLAPIMDGAFLAHLRALSREGLSMHGARYLMQLQREIAFPDLSLELVFEYARWKGFPARPSRFQSFFGWRDWKDAVNFGKQSGGGSIYEVRCAQEDAFFADMNAIRLSYDEDEASGFAKQYWRGEPKEHGTAYAPLWECLMPMPVEIIRPVTVNPVTGELADTDE